MVKAKSLDDVELTGPERKMYEVLRDGCKHTRGALQRAAWGAEGEDYAANLRIAVSNIRKVIVPLGFDVVIRYDNMKSHYMMVRVVSRDDTPTLPLD